MALEIFDLPEIAGGFFRHIIFSIDVVTFFTAWCRLATPFISILRNERITEFRVEQDWMVRVTQFSIVLFGIALLLNVWEIDISGVVTGIGVIGAGLVIAAPGHADATSSPVLSFSSISLSSFKISSSECRFLAIPNRPLAASLVAQF